MHRNGFRVCLTNQVGLDSPKKYLIYIDLDKVLSIRDLLSHVKNVLKIDDEVNLLVGESILPISESINVIEPDDDIRLCLEEISTKKTELYPTESTQSFLFTKPINGYITEEEEPCEPKSPPTKEFAPQSDPVPQRKKKKAKRKPPSMTGFGGLALCLQALKQSEGILQEEAPPIVFNEQSEMSAFSPKKNGVEYSNVDGRNSPMDSSSTCNLEKFESINKKKRKRKRKSKSRTPSVIVIQDQSTTVLSECRGEVKEPKNKMESSKSKKKNHVFFSDSDTEQIEKHVLADVEVVESNHCQAEKDNVTKVSLSRNQDWQSKLLALAKEPLENKVFSRHSSIPMMKLEAGVTAQDSTPTTKANLADLEKTVNILQYPVVDKVRQNDIISFKVLKLGPDYCPAMSGYVTAKVKNVDEVSQRALLIVLRGKEEFNTPEGKFCCVEDETATPKNRDKIVDLHISELIEPRLMFP